ncbi:MAG: STAS domain-containing protein [Candidatus Sumerlaeia bacterium]|nr:STAS domain-containing protein [Candidatus Sumerlaeia bacterium]
MNGSSGPDILCTTLKDERIAVVRLSGRGNMFNAPALRSFAELLERRGGGYRFIIDVTAADMLDSTFLGVLSDIAIDQMRARVGKPVLVNPSEKVHRNLRTLGLLNMVEARDCSDTYTNGAIKRAEGTLEAHAAGPMSRIDHICLVLRAHQNLVELDENNRLEFQPMIDCLERSLENERAGKPS